MHLIMYIYIYIPMCVCIYIYIYIYIEREGEGETCYYKAAARGQARARLPRIPSWARDLCTHASKE